MRRYRSRIPWREVERVETRVVGRGAKTALFLLHRDRARVCCCPLRLAGRLVDAGRSDEQLPMFSSARCLLRSAFSALNVNASSASSSAFASSSSAVLPHVLNGARRYATEVTTAQQSPSEVNAALARTSVLYKTYKPITPGIRHLKRPLSPHLYQGRPLRELTIPLRKRGGRNHHGRITVRFRGGGHKQRIRIVDFMRTEPGPCDVVRIEYDPGRSAHIALVKNRNPDLCGGKVWSYILAPDNLRAGDVVESFRQGIPDGLVPGFVDSKEVRGMTTTATESQSEQSQTASTASLALGVLRSITIKPGNVVPLRLIPPGTIIHNVALNPQGRAVLVRSAGTFGQVVVHEDSGRYSHVRLQSGEVRKVLQDCVATIGKVSNPLWKNRNLGKAGRNRWLGRRPRVRGMAMNR